jgi:arsenical pump membrane protein
MQIPWIVPLVLVSVIIWILWRPWKTTEALPAFAGATVLFVLGFINLADLSTVFNVVSGAGITIVSTIIMSSVLDRAGFFRWAAIQVALKARGSGKTLFVLTLLLSFCMTMFFNNDGSILITTPIILEITKKLKFSKAQALPYLLGGCFIASSSSAPIGVSNLANLISLRIVGLNLNQYAALMFVPSIVGIACCGGLMYLLFRHKIPQRYQVNYLFTQVFPPGPTGLVHVRPPTYPHLHRSSSQINDLRVDRPLFIFGIVVVVTVRIGFFIGAYFNIPVQIIAVSGAGILLLFLGWRQPRGVGSILRNAPWHILVFAFGMYTIVYGLHKEGFTTLVGHIVETAVGSGLLGSIFVSGILLTLMSCLMNNLPSVMIGTIMLNDLHLHTNVLKLSYLANVLGSDIGSLLLPMGTLASLLWFHIVRKELTVSWTDYMKVSFVVIPPCLCLSLLTLYLWAHVIAV